MTINIIGIGLDGLAGLSESVRQVVKRGHLLVGNSRNLSYFSHETIPKLLLNDMVETLSELKQWLTNWERNYQTNPEVIFLVSGDPLFFDIGGLLAAQFPPDQLIFHPHISSMQLAFNRLQIPWEDARLITLNNRSVDSLTQALKEGVKKIGIFTSVDYPPQAIAQLILSLDLPKVYQFWVAENLGGENERVQPYSIQSINRHQFSPLNLVILLPDLPEVINDVNLANIPSLGIPDNLFFGNTNEPELITPRELRILALGELGLQPNQVIWDMQASPGSVSVEMARLFPNLTIYAIEKTASGTSLIEQNCRRFQIKNVISINGEVPAILHHLRTPDRIFIGNSDNNLPEILGTCSIRLSPGGRIVVVLRTLEHLNLALEWVKYKIQSEKSWNYHLLQVHISRSFSSGSLTKFAPVNPVTILTIEHQSLFN
ncbi:MAG: precorrin-6y C5,15-methyltransferase (decarboxylating) subunit CbiE [Arthrospira sp. SH-MAG29]|nr:precorrin-6y C5,15-methyltransferase (decarboxylating) subunit CbiE [Arthrospira sp. SH-MAG29]MBS0018381.1 precorrin-6y C5,15-methyltransferase (decarboxylating) subunit CbiE [Arthrospira sp. SH-MAG29]